MDGEPAGGSLRATNTVTWPAGPPWSYLRDPRGASATGQVWECFSDGDHTLRMDVLADGPTEIVQCGFPRDDSRAAPTIPMRLFKRQGTNAWFLAAYRLVPKPDEPVELKVMPLSQQKMEIAVRIRGTGVSAHSAETVMPAPGKHRPVSLLLNPPNCREVLGGRWLARNGADTALESLRWAEPKAVCAPLTHRTPRRWRGRGIVGL